ncbi:MAG: ABC transporter permease subunit [Rhodospirillales bacterium]|nr:ABC transporter permease subunit [Rhodospirillales bacterium]
MMLHDRSPALSRHPWRAVSFVLVFGAWEIAGRIPISLAFPTFGETVAALLALIADGSLIKAYASTLQPLLIGIAVSAVVGVAAGVGMGLSRSLEWLALPIFIILQAAPLAAIIPLITYIYGIGLTAKSLAVILLATPVVVMNAYKGIRNTDPSLIAMGRSFLGTRTQQILKIMIPHARGLIFAGLRLGLAMGFVGVVVAELLITPTGIGDLITYHGSVANYAEMYASIVSIVALAAVTIGALERVERRLFRATGAAA